jgi:hypothetical protein
VTEPLQRGFAGAAADSMFGGADISFAVRGNAWFFTDDFRFDMSSRFQSTVESAQLVFAGAAPVVADCL